MIGYLKGKILAQVDGAVILDVAGVGYEVWVGEAKVGEPGAEAEFWIHTHVREDQLALFGFKDPLQKRIFLILLGITGIGPKVAMAATSALEPGELVDAVTVGNTTVLRTIPGVGKKMADRMVLELRDKLGSLVKQATWSEAANSSAREAGVWSDLQEALSGLGFADVQIRNVIRLLRQELEGHAPVINELLKLALQRIRNC